MMKHFYLDAYHQMLLIRRFEERAGYLYGIGEIAGFCHLYIGQEAVAVGIYKAMEKQDSVITSYRDHGFALVCGMSPNSIMAELTGRSGGCSRGKGGSMHMFDPSVGFYGGHGIVGAQVPLGTGIALANKYKETNGVSITVFGDGALNQGQVYESFNMAKLMNLPVVYVVENNIYGMGTSIERACSTPNEIYKRGESFGIDGVAVDGMDFFKVYEIFKTVIDNVRKTQKPMLVEVKTYRYRGHSMSDPAKYRSKEEVDEYKSEHDPIENLKSKLLKDKLVTEEDITKVDEEVKRVVAECVEFAKTSKEPDESELFTDIYVAKS